MPGYVSFEHGNGAPGAGFKKNEIKFPKSVFFVG